MTHTKPNNPPPCENDPNVRHGLLLPKIIHAHAPPMINASIYTFAPLITGQFQSTRDKITPNLYAFR